jgi:hypothetical protein
VLEHEDKGMMQVIEIYDPHAESSLTTFWKSLLPQAHYMGRICGAKTLGTWDKLKKMSF